MLCQAREKEETEEDEGFGDGGPGDDTAAAFAPLEFELDDGPAIEALLAAYPNSVVGSKKQKLISISIKWCNY